jgi:hypothetical protein
MCWMMTETGFVSVVKKGGGLMVRSRDRESLEAFCALARVDSSRIVEGGGTDYQFRVRRVSKRDVKRAMCATVDGIEYSNFKDRAKIARGKTYANFLSRVWSAGWDLVPADVLARERARDKQRLAALPASRGRTITSSRWGDLDWSDKLEDDDLDFLEPPEEDDLPPLHEMTDEQWDAFMRENPAGI